MKGLEVGSNFVNCFMTLWLRYRKGGVLFFNPFLGQDLSVLPRLVLNFWSQRNLPTCPGSYDLSSLPPCLASNSLLCFGLTLVNLIRFFNSISYKCSQTFILDNYTLWKIKGVWMFFILTHKSFATIFSASPLHCCFSGVRLQSSTLGGDFHADF